jgi:hypothetical protein
LASGEVEKLHYKVQLVDLGEEARSKSLSGPRVGLWISVEESQKVGGVIRKRAM